MQGNLRIKALKVNVVVPAEQLPPLPEGEQAMLFLATPDKLIVKARLNPKSYRRVLAAIAQHGAENVAVLVQGQMSKADEIESAGISAVLKKPKETIPEGGEVGTSGVAKSDRTEPVGDRSSQEGLKGTPR